MIIVMIVSIPAKPKVMSLFRHHKPSTGTTSQRVVVLVVVVVVQQMQCTGRGLVNGYSSMRLLQVYHAIQSHIQSTHSDIPSNTVTDS
jgi:hypothetical protein